MGPLFTILLGLGYPWNLIKNQNRLIPVPPPRINKMSFIPLTTSQLEQAYTQFVATYAPRSPYDDQDIDTFSKLAHDVIIELYSNASIPDTQLFSKSVLDKMIMSVNKARLYIELERFLKVYRPCSELDIFILNAHKVASQLFKTHQIPMKNENILHSYRDSFDRAMLLVLDGKEISDDDDFPHETNKQKACKIIRHMFPA